MKGTGMHHYTAGTLSVYLTPWAYRALSDEDREALHGCAVDGSLAIFGQSSRGPWTGRLNVKGHEEIRAEGSTIGSAIAAAIGKVAA